ncbi:MAG TPA: 3-isopropylmalate dehydratase small subunit [Alphaproteobacteria bacterium]|nr:3-isopropylmalate dehydratase small subunit [Alphaproteobacteria bacterium]
MEPFTRLRAPAVALGASNIDTDQIIPARFLRKPRAGGYQDFAFHDLRFDAEGRPRPEFPLNFPAAKGARILVAGRNFGCGSSREGAVYALYDWGIRAVIAPSIADIFANNSVQNGLLPVILPEAAVNGLMRVLADGPGIDLTVDLERQEVEAPDGTAHRFDIDPSRRHALLNGLDDIAMTRRHLAEVDAFERALEAGRPWMTPANETA